MALSAASTASCAKVMESMPIYTAIESATMPGHVKTKRIGVAESEDGIRFSRSPLPVVFPAEDG